VKSKVLRTSALAIDGLLIKDQKDAGDMSGKAITKLGTS